MSRATTDLSRRVEGWWPHGSWYRRLAEVESDSPRLVSNVSAERLAWLVFAVSRPWHCKASGPLRLRCVALPEIGGSPSNSTERSMPHVSVYVYIHTQSYEYANLS